MNEKIINDLKNGDILPIDQLFTDSFKESVNFPILEYSLIVATLFKSWSDKELHSLFFGENKVLLLDDRIIDLVIENLEKLNQKIQQEITNLNNDEAQKLHNRLIEKMGFKYSFKSVEKIKMPKREDYKTFIYLILTTYSMYFQNRNKPKQSYSSKQEAMLEFKRPFPELTKNFFDWLETNVYSSKYGLASLIGFIANHIYEGAIARFKKFARYNSANVRYMMNFLPQFPQYVQKWVAIEILKGREVENYENIEIFRTMILNEKKISNISSRTLISDYNFGKLVLLILPSLLVGKMLADGFEKFIENK